MKVTINSKVDFIAKFANAVLDHCVVLSLGYSLLLFRKPSLSSGAKIRKLNEFIPINQCYDLPCYFSFDACCLVLPGDNTLHSCK